MRIRQHRVRLGKVLSQTWAACFTAAEGHGTCVSYLTPATRGAPALGGAGAQGPGGRPQTHLSFPWDAAESGEKGGVGMAQKLPSSGGDRSAPRVRVRVTARKLRPVIFRTLFRAVQFLGLVLRVLNEAKDLLRG